MPPKRPRWSWITAGSDRAASASAENVTEVAGRNWIGHDERPRIDLEARPGERVQPPGLQGLQVVVVAAVLGPLADVLHHIAVHGDQLRVVGGVVEVQRRQVAAHALPALARVAGIRLFRPKSDVVVPEQRINLSDHDVGHVDRQQAENLGSEAGHDQTLTARTWPDSSTAQAALGEPHAGSARSCRCPVH